MLTIAGILLLSLIGTFIAVRTFSRFSSEDETYGRETLEEFYASARLYTTQNGERTEVPLTVDANGRKYYDLSAEDFEKVSVDVSYYGKARNYVRMRLDTSWYRINEENKEQL